MTKKRSIIVLLALLPLMALAAAAVSRFDSDLQVDGHLTAKSMSIPASSIDDEDIKAGANIDPTKMRHEFRARYTQEASGNAAAATTVLHNARAAGTVNGVKVGLVTPPDTAVGSSGRTATIDIKKNGTTILSATVTLDSTNTAYVAVAGTVSSAAYSAGDTFTAVQTVGGSAGTHAKGVFVELSLYESPG
jgi:hypothetical protein